MKIPERIAKLPTDKRGYPIPWNVLRGHDGTPFFTINDDRKHFCAVAQGLCPLCGEKLGKWKWFVGGPRSAFDIAGAYIDLPMHHECATFALATCPYLAMPRYLKATDAIPHPENLPPEARVLVDETVNPERPTLFVAVASAVVLVKSNYPMLPHVRPQRPAMAYEFWRHGKKLTDFEALPLLREVFSAAWNIPQVNE